MNIVDSFEDKIIYGSETNPMQKLYKKDNRNLRGHSKSDVPKISVNVLAWNAKSKDTIVSIIDVISNTSLYQPNAKKFA
jgi:hypothetical protein